MFFENILQEYPLISKFVVPLHCKLEIAIQEMNDKIKHTGIIDSTEENHIKVRIFQTSACASCKVASQCNASESKEKLIDVFANGHNYKVGQEVTVTASRDVAKRALVLGFGLPFLILLVVLFAVYHLTGNEATAALSSVGALLPYYLIIWLMREKIARSVSFQIE